MEWLHYLRWNVFPCILTWFSSGVLLGRSGYPLIYIRARDVCVPTWRIISHLWERINFRKFARIFSSKFTPLLVFNHHRMSPSKACWQMSYVTWSHVETLSFRMSYVWVGGVGAVGKMFQKMWAWCDCSCEKMSGRSPMCGASSGEKDM